MLSLYDEKTEIKVQNFFKKIKLEKTRYKIAEFDSQNTISEAIYQALEIIREEKGGEIGIKIISLYSSNKELEGLGVMFKPFGNDGEYQYFIPIQFEEEILLPNQILVVYR